MQCTQQGPGFLHGPRYTGSLIACCNPISGDTWLTCSHTGLIRRAALSILVATDTHAVAVSSAGQLALHGCKTNQG